jgi:hypothetical protein
MFFCKTPQIDALFPAQTDKSNAENEFFKAEKE